LKLKVNFIDYLLLKKRRRRRRRGKTKTKFNFILSNFRFCFKHKIERKKERMNEKRINKIIKVNKISSFFFFFF
jgi:hypothetical protein